MSPWIDGDEARESGDFLTTLGQEMLAVARQHGEGDAPELRTFVFLSDGKHGTMGTGGFSSAEEAIPMLLEFLKHYVQSVGGDVKAMPIPKGFAPPGRPEDQ